MRTIRIVAVALLAGCSGQRDTTSPLVIPVDTTPLAPSATAVLTPNVAVAAAVGAPLDFDASQAGTTFSDPAKRGLTYSVSFFPEANGLQATGSRITGVPKTACGVTVTITATDALNRSASNSFAIVTFSADLDVPVLPAVLDRYSDADVPLPLSFTTANVPGGSVVGMDNTPQTNRTTNAGATLGRVLFYDRRLSANDRVACASCHLQSLAFGDTARFSRGFLNGITGRHSMGLANARFYANGRFFWDERAATLEAQTLRPIQDATEMGMTLDLLEKKLALTPFYRNLFQAAFGSSEITSDKISLALSQFVRSLTSGNSKYDLVFASNPPKLSLFTPEEAQGQQLFNGGLSCVRCHSTNAQIGVGPRNNGLDAVLTDVGVGNGRFKVPSLRNVSLRPPYMHDGRFATLEQVVEFYDHGVQVSPGVDPTLRNPDGTAHQLNLSTVQKAALVAFLRTLTDSTFIRDPRFSSPFAR